MLRIRSIATAALALGITSAIPAFSQAAERGHTDRTPTREVHTAARTQTTHQTQARTQIERRVETHVQAPAQRRVETRVEEHRAPVIERGRIERERVIRDVHVDRGYRYDRGVRVGVDILPVYPTYPVYVNNDCDISLSLSDVPGCVLDTAARECQGDIESARLIRSNGLEYYRLIVDTRSGAFEVHVDAAGRLLSVGRC